MATGRVPTTANSPLTAKGDLFGYSTTQARVPVGNDGETIVADSSTSTGLRYQGNYAAGKNAFINGDFGVWQRGTTFTPTTGGGAYTADRYNQVFDVAPTSGSITQQTFTSGTAPVAGYEGQYFYRTTITTPGSNTYYILGQRIEDVREFAGQTVTVSFWAKLNSGAISSARIRLSQNFGSGGSATVTLDNSYSFTPTGSWQRFSWTIALPSISGKTIGTGSYLQIDSVVAYAAANTVDFWGWQIEAGNTATAFQTATGTIQGELAACQRYYVRYAPSTNNYAYFGNGTNSSTTNAYITIPLPVEMRVIPTSVDTTTASLYRLQSGSSSFNLTSLTIGTIGDGTKIGCLSANVSSGLTTGGFVQLLANFTTSAFVGFSAEL